ncbi:cytochrome b [Azospirillum sp. ST 5-10]|uniref:cytochrome b n=1 Tax=unclassified Azospirillum TaxID=2630922 RepID=UPI003F49DEC8
MTEKNRYDLGFQALHWGMALVILAAWLIPSLAEDLPRGPERLELMALHKSLGVTLLALLVLRVVWRAVNPPPTPSPRITPWMHRAALVGHLALYAVMLALPVVGVLMSQAKGQPVSAWGLVTLPTLLAEDRDLGHTLEEVHEVLGNAILVLAGLHAAAALVHQYVLKDGVLARMLPWETKPQV